MGVDSRRCRETKGFELCDLTVRVMSRSICETQTKHKGAATLNWACINLSALVLKTKLIIWVNQPHLVQHWDATVWTCRPAQTFAFWVRRFAVAEIPQASGVDEIMAYLFKASSGFFSLPTSLCSGWETVGKLCSDRKFYSLSRSMEMQQAGVCVCVCVKVCTAVV